MDIHAASPGRYSLAHLAEEARLLVPELVRTAGDAVAGLVGPERVDGKIRLLVQLRMARRLGCPVCVGLFPPLAARAGLSDTAVASALAGSAEGLAPAEHAAVAWVDRLLTDEADALAAVPEPARLLSEAQRRHLLFVVRLERVVHATGLLFLPHRWIDRVRGGPS
ncbi:MAG: carboxymuconolactone decarboxylase family protein [Polyangiaceae bacterium]|nr:carboxymuconolactone decarboxylase family protein [Polyangiaceae bacterium]